MTVTHIHVNTIFMNKISINLTQIYSNINLTFEGIIFIPKTDLKTLW